MKLKENNSLKRREYNKNKNRNNAYSPCYNHCTKLLRSSNGTNVEERINIEYIENL